MSPATSHDADRPLRALWKRYGAYRGRFVGAVVASTVNKVADVMPELLIGAAVDVVVRGDASFVGELLGVESRYAQLGWIAAVNVVVWIIESVSDYIASVLWRGLAQGVEHDLRVEAYDHVQHLDLGWHESRPAGATLATLNDDVNQLERFLDIGAPAILQTTLNVLLVGAVFAAASGQLLVLAFLPIPLIVIGSLVFQRRLEPLYVHVRSAVADLSGTLSANLAGIATIKAFTAEDRERDRVRAVSQAYRDANTTAIRSSAAFVPLVRMAILAGFTCTLLLGGWATLRGDLEVGLYSVLVFMTQRLLWPLTDVAEVLDLYQRGRASTARILGLLEEPVSVKAGVTALARPVAGRIELQGVRAGYGEGPDVLHGIDLVVPAGETHAIVGATGSGKSSLLRLVLRFDDPRSGRVLLDGQDVRDLDWDSLRGSMGYVAQDVFMFAGSIADNISYGRPEATREQVRAAADAAAALDFVERLPDGLDTLGRGAGCHPLRRPAPAARPGAGAAARPLRARAGRGHQRRRQRDRGRHPAVPAAGHGRVHRPGRRPPPLHRPARALHLGARRRSGHRGRHPRRAGRARRRVRRPLAGPDGGAGRRLLMRSSRARTGR